MHDWVEVDVDPGRGPGPVKTSSGPISVAHATSTMKRLVRATVTTARRPGDQSPNARMA
jgi:hypothetical protein